MPRYVVIDFETNGFSVRDAERKHWTLPWQNYPCQLSVDVVDDGEVWHAFDTLIRGAIRFGKWSKENLNFTVEEANEKGQALPEVIQRLAELDTPDTTIVAHNIQFDLDHCLARTASRLECDSAALQAVLSAPRLCTMRSAYSKMVFGRGPSLGALCKHFQIDYSTKEAHDAAYDTKVLAQCVAAALRRGVML